MGTYVPVTKNSLGLGNVDNTSDATKNSASATLTNKTINAPDNTITNIAVSNLAASTVVTASETIGSNNNDTTIPTSAAVKSYVDSNGSAWSQVLRSNLQNTVPVYVTMSGWNFSNSTGQQIHITAHIGSGTAGVQVYLEHKQGTLGAVAAFGSGINNLLSGGVSELAWWLDTTNSIIYLRLTMSTTGNDWRATLIEVANAPTITSSTSTTEPVGATWTALTSAAVLAGRDTVETLTNKTLSSPVLSGTITGTYTFGGTPTFPSTVVTTTGTQTLTNKTLTSPIISSISNTGTLTLPTSTDTLVGRATSDTLTNKTLTSPVLNGTVSGTGVSTSPTASTLALRDANSNLSASLLLLGFTSTATAASTTTLTMLSNQVQVFTGTSTQTVVLPTTSVVVGTQFRIVNNSTGTVTVQSSGLNTIVALASNTSALLTALVATPTTAANWEYQYWGTNIASSKTLAVSNSLTLAGTDGTTMTFPGASDTVTTNTATQTLTNKTFSAPVLSGTITGTYTFGGTPTFPSTVVTTTSTQTLTNKTFDATTTAALQDDKFTLQSAGDATKKIRFDVSPANAGATTTYILPSSGDTTYALIGDDTTQTLSNKTLDASNSITMSDANFTLQDDADSTKVVKITLDLLSTGRSINLRVPNVASGNHTLVTLNSTATLQNKTMSGVDNTFSDIPVSALGTGRVTGSDNGTQTSLTLWKGTNAQYVALGTYDPNTIYVVTT